MDEVRFMVDVNFMGISNMLKEAFLMPFAPNLRMHLLRLVEDSSARVEQHHLHTISVTNTPNQRHQIQSISGLARMC